VGLAFKLARMTDTIAYIQARPKRTGCARTSMRSGASTHKYLYLSGYLTYRLTGRFVDSVGCQVGFMPFDYKKLRWAANWDWKWQVVPMAPDAARLTPPSRTVGRDQRRGGVATGIPAGLPMIAAAADKACEVIGAGSLAPHVGCSATAPPPPSPTPSAATWSRSR
jgi:sugar (pentulose or hexulose) kinase